MTQSARNEALAKFKNGEVPLLVASDVAARGIDIAGLSHVFNFDVPHNPEDYVHRIGRTGRAGKSGRAFTLVANDDDSKAIRAIEKLIGKTITPVDADAGSEDKPREDKPKSQKKETASSSRRGSRHGNTHDERPAPPESRGDSFRDTDHVPAFLTR